MRVSFKGKIIKADTLALQECVAIPVIQPHHVVTPISELTSRERLWLDCQDGRLRKLRTTQAFKDAGTDGYRIPLSDSRVTPIGNGFMARVTLDLNV